ncbi:hypothetical protein [Aneurinibacillus uraniidurans]|uniref:hypothetical protein n=1 Tax=Aneurinibacillus uraniidurans TaxID=2966586 RepID=UPI00234A7554|nr:hypothetical protein [Aneurinibacillus sp. B1]WCN36597.1 hypothetical protein PO771_12010 [Aneurinibacillus sp. B1]
MLTPTFVIDIMLAFAIVFIAFFVFLFIPRNYKKTGIRVMIAIVLLEISFFALRPFWIDYRVEKTRVAVNQYLARKYPGESWTIVRGDKDNPHHKAYFLNVTFHNEANFTYTYYTNTDNEVKQSSISCPDGKFPQDGKHTEWYQDKPK